MSFTPEHIEILEKHREHWDTLTGAGYMRNLDNPVKQELQRVFNEAVGPQRFTLWCNDCVVDMVRLLYTNYEAAHPSVVVAPADATVAVHPPRKRRHRR